MVNNVADMLGDINLKNEWRLGKHTYLMEVRQIKNGRCGEFDALQSGHAEDSCLACDKVEHLLKSW